MTYEEYEQKCDEIRVRNVAYLDDFKEDLINSGLKEKTIARHCQNVDFYINTYLLRKMPLQMTSGASDFHINDFLGDFFIRKCMWSTTGTIKSTAASIKKFYKCMLQQGNINELEYRGLVESIKNNMDGWLQDCEAFNDPNAYNPFAF